MTQRGRPTKYRPEMCDKVIELMKEWASIEEICLELEIHKEAFYNWIKKYEDFANAVEHAKQYSKGWWYKMWRVNMFEEKDWPKFNANLYNINMKNRFGWADKQQVEQSWELNISYNIDF